MDSGGGGVEVANVHFERETERESYLKYPSIQGPSLAISSARRFTLERISLNSTKT